MISGGSPAPVAVAQLLDVRLHRAPVVRKLLVYLFVIVLAMIAAGVYGMLHNQISYTVSPEYFTKFKFQQFGLTDTAIPERLRASMVGFLAAWWMGIPIGLLVGGAGFIHPSAQRMLHVTLWSFLLIIGITFLFGVAGLVYGFYETRHIVLADYRGWFIPRHVTNLRRFLCAGYMHDSSYIGGTVAIPIAWVFHIVARVREWMQPNTALEPTPTAP